MPLRYARSAARRSARPAARRPRARWVVAAIALLVLLPVAAAALPIEDYAEYDPQTNCSPDAKPGAARLSEWLQQQYPGTGSMGISRSCKDGGVSEHKEGRAFDWAASVHSSRDRASVRHFFQRIFAADAEGNPHALARRMGIMYLIWNDHIWSSYRGFEPRPYLGCQELKGCSDTRRHRNHVHISLSRAGGDGKTSWYADGATPPPPKPTIPVLDLSKQRYGKVMVPATGATTRTPWRLEAGTSYKVTVGGLYTYGVPAQVADASCRWLGGTRSWTPYPSTAVARSHGSLNLLLDGRRLAPNRCRGSHVYATVVKPRTTKRLALKVATAAGVSGGALTVLVSSPKADVRAGRPTYPALSRAPRQSEPRTAGGLISETVGVPAASGSVWTAGSLQQGADYRITVGGTADLGSNLGRATTTDGRCVNVGGTWHRQASLDRRVPGAEHAKLYVDGVLFAGRAASGATCATRTHVLDWKATRSSRLELSLWDPLTRGDDSGALTVSVQRLTPMTTPTAATAERPAKTTRWRRTKDTVNVLAGARNGAVSRMRLRAGQRVDLVARGTQRSGPVQADASCVRTPSGWRSTDRRVALGQDPLDLWVDGRRVVWRPVGGRTGCSSGHAYRARFQATKHGPVRLAVLDLYHRDNRGALEVSLTRRD